MGVEPVEYLEQSHAHLRRTVASLRTLYQNNFLGYTLFLFALIYIWCICSENWLSSSPRTFLSFFFLATDRRKVIWRNSAGVSLCENRFLVNLMYPEEFCFPCYSFIGNRRTVPHLVSGILTPSHGSLIRNVTICSSVSLFSFWPKKHWFCKGLWT